MPLLLADLGFTIESDRELGTVRAGTHDYVSLGPASTVMDASRPLPGANGNLTVYLRKGGGISLAFGTSAPVPRTRGSVLWVRRGGTSWEFSGEVESNSYALTGGSLVLVPRRSGGRIVLPTTVLRVDRPEAVVGQRRLRFSAVLHQEELLGRFERPEFMDACFTAEVWPYPDPLDLRVRRLAPRGRLIMPASVFSDGTSRRRAARLPHLQGRLPRVRVPPARRRCRGAGAHPVAQRQAAALEDPSPPRLARRRTAGDGAGHRGGPVRVPA